MADRYCFKRVASRFWVCLVAIGGGVLPPSAGAPLPLHLPILTNASDVINLSWEEAELKYPVQLQGTITYYRPEWRLLFLQDNTGGIYVFAGQHRSPIATGDTVKLTGESGLGTLGPIVVEPKFEHLPTGEPPKAQSRSVVELASSCCDAQWVQIEAVAQSLNRGERGDLVASLGTYDHPVRAILPFPTNRPPPALEDARIRLTGVCAISTDEQACPTAVILYVPGWSNLEILEPPREPSSAGPLREIRALASATPKEHRLRVKGTVTHHLESGSFYLEDRSGGILVEPREAETVLVGEILEAQGFFTDVYGPPRLQAAILRRSWTFGPLVPRALKPGEGFARSLQGRLVTLEAELLQANTIPGGETLLCRIGATPFTAEFTPHPSAPRLPRVTPGSFVRLTGISVFGPDPRNAARLLLRNATDLKVLRRPGWWAFSGILGALAVALVTAFFAWNWRHSPPLRRLAQRVGRVDEPLSRDLPDRVEPVCVRELVEDVLRLNQAEFLRRGIHLRRDFAATPSIAGDRSKILLILLDLITDTLRSYSDDICPQQQLTVRIRSLPEGFVKIAISDPGTGIAATRLERILDATVVGPKFRLGRTAMTAREIGGSLSASSGGPGRGASFVLLLPVRGATEAL